MSWHFVEDIRRRAGEESLALQDTSLSESPTFRLEKATTPYVCGDESHFLCS
jgi:hypothetical protein